jgi:hypothetical protein
MGPQLVRQASREFATRGIEKMSLHATQVVRQAEEDDPSAPDADERVLASYLEALNAAIAAGEIVPRFPDGNGRYTYAIRAPFYKIVMTEMEKELRSGKSRDEVAARFPGFIGPLRDVIGDLRAQGVLPPGVKRAAA